MDIYLECGPVVFLLRDFCDKSPFATWQWKLEPFKTKSVSGNVTEIAFNKNSVSLENAIEVSCKKDGFYTHKVLKTDSGTVYTLVRSSTAETLLSFFADDLNNKIYLLADNTQTFGQGAFEYLSRIAFHKMLGSGIITFHGVLMEFNGKGIIISAPSETGKTTHARLWRDEKNALIINGDNSCCFKENGVWSGFGCAWSGTSGEQINRKVEIAAAVVLERAEENKAVRIDEYEAFTKLNSLIQYPSWDKNKTEKAMELCDEFLKDVPVFNLKCRPDTDAVNTLYKVLEDVL